LYFARRHLADPQLEFVDMPTFSPPEVEMDPELIKMYEKEVEEGTFKKSAIFAIC
jgi:hypothetical protein